MDKKQVHKIGKKLNKPIKFVKQNMMTILSVASLVTTIIALNPDKKE